MINYFATKQDLERGTVLRPNFFRCNIMGLSIWFSHGTIVAFRHNGNFYCCENIWSNTTGKHLNDICPDHKKRLPLKQFLQKLNEVYYSYEDTRELCNDR